MIWCSFISFQKGKYCVQKSFAIGDIVSTNYTEEMFMMPTNVVVPIDWCTHDPPEVYTRFWKALVLSKHDQ